MNDCEEDETERLGNLSLLFIGALSSRFPGFEIRNQSSCKFVGRFAVRNYNLMVLSAQVSHVWRDKLA